jgi:AbrB family looped-hinge helix DNA binding protein
MRVTMDGAGRIVIPKSVRDGLGLQAGSELNLDVVDDHLELSVAPVPMRLERRDGRMVVVPERDVPPLTTEMVRELLERGRR